MTTIHDYEVKTHSGAVKKLAEYKGKVLLLVNVASKCGLTPQYKELEALHRELGPKGLCILAFPANEFGAQEPGTDAEIQSFCTTQYDVHFEVLAKLKVKGDGIDPLFAALIAAPEFGGEIKWNFNKFLIGKDGVLRGRFEPTVAPSDAKLRGAIKDALEDAL